MAERNGRSPEKPEQEFYNTGLKPTRVVEVPEQYQRITLERECQYLVRTWKAETGCDVIIRGDKKLSGKIHRFEIAGTVPNAEKAVVEINKWIEGAITKTAASTAWAKVSTFNYNKWYYEQIRETNDLRKQIFKGPIPEGTQPPFKVIVEWPENLQNEGVYPKDVFGVNFQGLDAIRTNNEVFISAFDSHKFEIAGYEMIRVEAAEQLYFNRIQKVQMQVFETTQPTHIILDESEGTEVLLEAAEAWWPNRTSHRIVPRLIHHPNMHEPGGYRQESLSDSQLSIIEQNMQTTLEGIRYERSHYDFCIRFGCLALLHDKERMPETRIGKKYPKSSFLNAVNSVVRCEAKKWAMHDDDGQGLLRRLIKADNLLEPTRSADYYGHNPESLKDIRPIFRGTWIFQDPNIPRTINLPMQGRSPGRSVPQEPSNTLNSKNTSQAGFIVVQVEWTDDEHGMYEKSPPCFYRLKPGHAGPKENMDIKLLELGEGKAWQFSLESMAPLLKKTVPLALQDFAKEVSLVPGYQIHSKDLFAKWRNPGPSLQAGRMDKIYSFGIRKTCYKVEMTGMWYPARNVPCWGISVRHKGWKDHLIELDTLPPGGVAQWGDVIETFLPEDGLMSSAALVDGPSFENQKPDQPEPPPRNGIRVLMSKLMHLSEIIHDTGSIRVPQMEAIQPEDTLD